MGIKDFAELTLPKIRVYNQDCIFIVLGTVYLYSNCKGEFLIPWVKQKLMSLLKLKQLGFKNSYTNK